MSNYTENANSCRVDFFKASGKWYTTEAVQFDNDLYHMQPVDAVKIALQRHLDGRLSGMTAVCLQPYNENSFPIMLVNIG